MDFRGDRRGQSIQVGAVLLFGILIVFFASYQAFVVPSQNAEAEAEHQQVIDRQMQDLRNAIVSLPGTQSDRSVTLTLGTRYPTRIIALNPPPPSGTVRTVGTSDESVNLTVANANATDDETGDFWDGENQSRNTGGIAYAPNYHEYENPPTIIYENTLLYKEFRSGNFTVTGQRLVDGKRLTLVTVNGSLDRGSGESVSLDVEAASASTTSVQITNETGENVTLRVASQRDASTWRDVFEDEQQFIDQGGHVVRGSVTETALPDRSFDLITVELEQGVRYSLRMAKAGVGSRVASEDEAYLTDVSGDGATVTQGNSQELVVEARDRYNNPVGGVEVFGEAEAGSLDESSIQTDIDGQASFIYDSSGVSANTDDTIDFSIVGAPDPSFDAGAPENVTTSVTVQQSSGPSSTTEADQVNLDTASVETKAGNANAKIEFDLQNTGSTEVSITAIAVDSTDSSATFVENEENPNEFVGGGGNLNKKITIGDPAESLDANATISASSTETFTLGQFRDGSGNPGRINMNNQETTISLTFGDGSTKQYTLES